MRPDWAPAVNGLAAFFAAHEAFARKVRIVDNARPHVIDLLDALAF